MYTTNNTPRSKALLEKVYDHLDTIDIAKLSTSELRDFLEVVQKGQFLESYGQAASFGFGGMCAGSFNGPGVGQGNAGVCEGSDTHAAGE